ncbi:MAG TPA: RagB/SusD family nutrient uptake outer membrane protein, partial [Chitinophaga sp.]
NFYLSSPKCARSDATYYTTLKLKQANKTFKLVPWNSDSTHARHPYYKKFRAGVGDGIVETETAILSANPSTNKALDIIRYPMVLLNYAEASAMAANAPTAASYGAINQVRQRAGLPNLTPGLTLQAFRDSVVAERGWEFAGEFGIRWFDIVRLQMLPKILAKRGPQENPINPAVLSNPAVLAQKYLAPIPANEMSRNPGWQQNPGY